MQPKLLEIATALAKKHRIKDPVVIDSTEARQSAGHGATAESDWRGACGNSCCGVC